MSFVVKAEKALDSNKPPNYWTVNETEVILQNRSARSQNTENYYHISPVRSGDDTIPLEATAPHSVSSSDSEDNILKKLEWAESDDSVFYGRPRQDRPEETKTATQSIDLSSIVITTAGTPLHLEAVYVDKLTDLHGSTTVSHVIPSQSVIYSAPSITALQTVTEAHAPTYFAPPHDISLASDLLPPAAVADEHLDSSSANSDSSDTESDIESDMADINPTAFSGIASENAEAWMRYFVNFCEFKAHAEAKMLALFKVLMVGSAATWLDSLPDDTRNNWEALKDAFLTRYTTAEFLNYKNARELFNSKQEDKSVDDYCAHMQRIARQVGADDRMLRFSVLNGLRPDIANYVTQKQPTDWQSLLEAARVGEMCSTTHSQSDTVVTSKLSQMQDQLRQLSMRLDTPTVAQITEGNRSRSPLPSATQRDRFENENYRSRSYDRRPRFEERRWRYDNRSNSPNGRYGSLGRGQTAGYRRPDSPQRPWRNNLPASRRGTGFRGRGSYRGRGGRLPSWDNAPGRQGADPQAWNCGRCGFQRHDHFNDCPAINQDCRACGKKGHFQRVCRNTARAQTNWD